MEFDWRKAIDRCGEDLAAIAARLIAMAGIAAGRTVETLPRHLYFRVLALLRPAEFAVRRLIAMAACKLVTAIVCPDRKPGQPSPTSARREASRPTEAIAPNPAFALFDPFKPFASPWLDPDADDGDAWPIRDDHESDPYEPIDAKSICRRIRALADALNDLDRQALRLARWRARRRSETCRPRRFSPFRPGFPPGYRKRPKTAIEEVLAECNFLAHDAWNTS